MPNRGEIWLADLHPRRELRATLRVHVFEDAPRPVRAAAEPALQRTGNASASSVAEIPRIQPRIPLDPHGTEMSQIECRDCRCLETLGHADHHTESARSGMVR